jgi:histone H4
METPLTKKNCRAPSKNTQGIRDGMLKRLSQRAGVQHVGSQVYGESRDIIKSFLEAVLKDAVLVTLHAKRKKISQEDVLYALEKHFNKVYKTDAEHILKKCKLFKAKKGDAIQHYKQQYDCVFFSKTAFKNMVYDMASKSNDVDVMFSSSAMGTLQIAAEEYMTTMYKYANMCAAHDGRVTILPKDLKLTLQIRA